MSILTRRFFRNPVGEFGITRVTYKTYLLALMTLAVDGKKSDFSPSGNSRTTVKAKGIKKTNSSIMSEEYGYGRHPNVKNVFTAK